MKPELETVSFEGTGYFPSAISPVSVLFIRSDGKLVLTRQTPKEKESSKDGKTFRRKANANESIRQEKDARLPGTRKRLKNVNDSR